MHSILRKDRVNYSESQSTKIHRLGIVGFITSISLALINTIWAVYLKSFLNYDVLVGTFSAVFTAVSLLAYFYLIPIIEKNSKVRLYSIALTVSLDSYLLELLSEMNLNLKIFLKMRALSILQIT